MRGMTPAVAIIAVLAAMADVAHAFSTWNFTPVHLTEQAECILLLKVKPADDKGQCRAEVVRVLKTGKGRPKPGAIQTIDLSRSSNAEHAEAIREMVAANGDGPALLFIGRGENDEPISKLHLGGKWVSLDGADSPDGWEADVIDSHMEATWAGGTDMLLKLTELILKHPDTDVPVACGGSWEEPVEAGRVAGRVVAVRAVDIAGLGRPALFVASDAGDRVFILEAGPAAFRDATGRLKLASRSEAFAWADLDGDGRPDLASFDGKGLTVWSQDAAGTFSPAAVAAAPHSGCRGLAALGLGAGGRSGLVWSTGAAPVLLVPDGKSAGAFVRKPLSVADGALDGQADAGTPLVADFDGDGLADIVQPFAKGSLFFRGLGGGGFGRGTPCAVELGEGRTGAFLGDFDADGRIDVFTVAEDSPRLWQNAGGGRFENVFHLCGELSYISKPGCIGGNACDFNNDGRQDVFLFYPEMGPQAFFNRGFRSFGHAHKPIDLAETGDLPEALEGVRAGAMADLDDDGRQDMTLVLRDGSVRVLLQTRPDASAPVLRVPLAAGKTAGGPVTVSATDGRRELGAWAVSPATGEAFFALPGPGEITVTWRMPGGEPQKRTFGLDGRVRMVVGGTLPTGPPPWQAAAIEGLIADLGSDDFETRDSASDRLTAMGGAVRKRVESALTSSDPEVRLRAGNILEALAAEEREVVVAAP